MDGSQYLQGLLRKRSCEKGRAMAKKTEEKETVGKAKGFEMPIDEESAGKVLDAIYRSALNGAPKVIRSVDEMVADYMGKAKSPDEAAKALAKWQVMKCGTSGFVTGLGGLITLPVAIPANINRRRQEAGSLRGCVEPMAAVHLDEILQRARRCWLFIRQASCASPSVCPS